MRILDSYDVVSNPAVNFAHNFIGYFFLWINLLFLIFLFYSLLSDKSEPLNNKSDDYCFERFRLFLFLLCILILDLLYLLSSGESDFHDDES